MRAIVIYDATKSMSRVTEAIADALRASDVAVDLHEGDRPARPFFAGCLRPHLRRFIGDELLWRANQRRRTTDAAPGQSARGEPWLRT